jgi:hypothetical protein
MLEVVAPVLHVTVPAHRLAVNTAVSVGQILFLSVITPSIFGATPAPITTGVDEVLIPQRFVQVAV